MSACFLGKAKKASEQAFFNGTIFVSTAEGAGTIPAPANIPITQIENDSTQGVVAGINNLDITMRSSRVYSEGLIKDQETPFSPVLSAISAR